MDVAGSNTGPGEIYSLPRGRAEARRSPLRAEPRPRVHPCFAGAEGWPGVERRGGPRNVRGGCAAATAATPTPGPSAETSPPPASALGAPPVPTPVAQGPGRPRRKGHLASRGEGRRGGAATGGLPAEGKGRLPSESARGWSARSRATLAMLYALLAPSGPGSAPKRALTGLRLSPVQPVPALCVCVW